MEKNNFGQIAKQIRQSKKLSEVEVTDDVIKQSQLSKFERGQTNMSIDKFYQLLENMKVSLDEFQSIYRDFTLSEEGNFAMELAGAYDSRDAAKLRKILKTSEAKLENQPKKLFNQIEVIIVKLALSYVTHFELPTEELDRVKDYLLDVENWGRYELWLLSWLLPVFDIKALRLLGQEILQKAEFYRSISINNRSFIRVILNLINVWLQKDDPAQALKYIKYLENRKLSLDYMYERLMLKYNKGLYQVKLGKAAGLDEIRECAQILETLGYTGKAEALRKEVAQLSETIHI